MSAEPGLETGPAPRFSWTPYDTGLFLRSARADSRLADLLGSSKFAPQRNRGAAAASPATRAAAFNQLYAENEGDPWRSASARYRYQARKYDALVAMLPERRRFARALDIGCGAGLMARRLASRCDSILAVDISSVAIEYARQWNPSLDNVSFQQHDILRPDRDDWTAAFDLIVVADTLYYLPGEVLSEAGLKSLALRCGRMLSPGGLILVANQFFFAIDAD